MPEISRFFGIFITINFNDLIRHIFMLDMAILMEYLIFKQVK
jgi:hypothetical protein